MTFAPKDVETLKTEVLEDLGLSDYEGNEEVVDRVVARRQKDEDLKVSLHTDKTNAREKLKEARKLAGLDPETGEKLQTNVVEPVKETSKNEEKDLSGDDLFALVEAKVQKVDLPIVKSTAKALGLSISEALNHTVLKTILKNTEEERRTAAAINTGNNRKTNVKTSEDALLKRVDTGDLADEEMQDAALAVLKSWGTK